MAVDADLVRCLLREQFPQWADEPVRAVEPGGWDNRTFRVGEHLTARLPSAAAYAEAVGKENRWLPVLAPHLPVPVPRPVALGTPGCGYPHPWSVRAWLPGEPAGPGSPADPVPFARDLAGFLAALQAVDTAGGPAAGPHSFGRGGPLSAYDGQTRATAAALADRVDEPAVLQVWDAAVTATHDGEPVWVHGDVTGTNLLVRDGRLSAVLDLGTCAVGDPACDLVVVWTLFDGASRAAFRGALSAGPATWARARGWALWKALLTVAEGPDAPAAVRRYGWRYDGLQLVRELVAEHRAAP